MFLSAAFLSLPARFFLLALFVLVMRVLDTIWKLLKPRNLGQMNPTLLHASHLSVKMFITFIVMSSFYPKDLQAKSLRLHHKSSLFLSRGEQVELPMLPQSEKFSIGNPQVLKYKYFPEKKQLVLVGKMVGYTDVVINTPKGKRTYQVYVLSKTQQLKIAHITEAIKETHLNIKVRGPYILVYGTVRDLNDYRLLKKLVEKNTKLIHLQVKLSPPLLKNSIGKIYSRLYSEGVKDLVCQNDNLHFYCRYNQSTPLLKKSKKDLLRIFCITFSPFIPLEDTLNYKLELKLGQVESQSKKDHNLGLDHLEGNLGELFSPTPLSTLYKNPFNLRDSKIKIDSLAEPSAVIQLGKRMRFKIGSQIPHRVESREGISTDWKFAGLTIDVLIEKKSNRYFMQYKLGITAPSEDQVVGSEKSASIEIPLNKPQKLFQTTYKLSNSDQSHIPVLGSIPLLGKLFRSSLDGESIKTIWAFIKLEKADK